MYLRSKHIHPRIVTFFLFLFASLFLALAAARPLFAHERVEVGPYVIIVGWEKEPVIVGERNALFFAISEDGQPVEGAESGLNLTVSYGGQTFRGNLNPAQEPGTYTTEILPTVRGQYEVLLEGTIGDTSITENIEPEEVLAASTLEFPEQTLEPLELQQALDDLTAQLQTARLLAVVGIAVGVIGIAVAVFALVRAGRA